MNKKYTATFERKYKFHTCSLKQRICHWKGYNGNSVKLFSSHILNLIQNAWQICTVYVSYDIAVSFVKGIYNMRIAAQSPHHHNSVIAI